MGNIQSINQIFRNTIFIMLLVSFFLFWIPVLGAFAAGFMGGKKAGNVNIAFLALIIPSLVFGIFLSILSSYLEALPVFGIVARQGGFYLALIYLVSIFLGTWIGVKIGEKK